MENKNNEIEFNTSNFIKVINKFKNMAILTLVIAFLYGGTITVLYLVERSSKEKEIYVVSDAGTFMAKRNDYAIRYDFEVKNHIRSFLALFYENDQHSFTKNVDLALNLIDKEDGKKVYKGFNEKAYEFYVQNNAYSKVVVDSMKVDMEVRPYRAKIWFKIILYYAGNSQPMYNAALMSISDNVRSEKNPFGLMIQNFQFIEYRMGRDRSIAIQDSLAKEKAKMLQGQEGTNK